MMETWAMGCTIHADIGSKSDKLPGQTVLRYKDSLYLCIQVWVWTNMPQSLQVASFLWNYFKAFLVITHKKLCNPHNKYKWWTASILTVAQYFLPCPGWMKLLHPILSMTNLSYLREWALAYGGNHLEFLLLNGRLMGELIWKEPPKRNNEFQM